MCISYAIAVSTNIDDDLQLLDGDQPSSIKEMEIIHIILSNIERTN